MTEAPVSRHPCISLNVTKTAAVVIDSGPQNTVRFGAGPLRFRSQVVARRIDVFEPFRAVMAGRIGTWVARDCHIRVSINPHRRDRVRRAGLLIVDEIGYLPVSRDGAVLFFQLINARYEVLPP